MRYSLFHTESSPHKSVMLFRSYAVATFAVFYATAVFYRDYIVFCKSVAVFAVGFCSRNTATYINFLRNSLKMLRVNTMPNPAQVIHYKISRYFAVVQYVGHFMGESVLPFESEFSVSFGVFTSEPNPTRFSFANFIPESFHRSCIPWNGSQLHRARP